MEIIFSAYFALRLLVVPYFLICGASVLYLNIRGPQKFGKFFMGVLESPGKVLDFLSAKKSGNAD